MEATPERRRWIRAASWIVISIVIVAVAAVIAAFVVRSSGRRRRDEALARIRDRGEPMRITEGMTAPSRTGQDPVAWLKSIDKLPYVEVDLASLPECSELLTRDKSGDDLGNEMERNWFEPTRIDPPAPCEIAFLRRQLELNPEHLTVAMAVDDCAPIDWTRVFADDGTVESITTRGPIPGEIDGVDLLTKGALDAAIHGQYEAAVRRLELAQRAASLFEDAPYSLGFLCWAVCQTNICNACARLAPMLPREVELARLEATLAKIEPRSRLRRALLGDRACGEGVFEALRNGTHGFEAFERQSDLPWFIERTWFEHDEADYLEEMERAIAAASQPHAVGGETVWNRRFYSCVSALMLPRWNEAIEIATTLEARLLTTRAACMARREGFDAARAWAQAQRDPFRDGPLETRVDGDGALSIWSVGSNGVDDGAPLPPWDREKFGTRIPDIVARCPPP